MMEGGLDGGGGRELAFAWLKGINESSQDEECLLISHLSKALMRRTQARPGMLPLPNEVAISFRILSREGKGKGKAQAQAYVVGVGVGVGGGAFCLTIHPPEAARGCP